MTTEVLALSGRGLTQSFGDRRLLWGSFVCFRPKQNGSTVYDGAFPRESKAAGSSQATYPYFEVVSGDEPSFKVMLLCWMHPFRILASFHLLFFSAISSLSIGLPVKPRPTSDGTPGIDWMAALNEGRSSGADRNSSTDPCGASKVILGWWLQARLFGVVIRITLYPPITSGTFATQLSS
jgi:hypothetical protein